MKTSDRDPATEAIVYVVDDDASARKALTRMFESQGWRVSAFESALEFLDSELEDASGCLILDVRMPGMSGLELQKVLAARHIDLPIVFITAHFDAETSERAMSAGAAAFLPKPLDNNRLVDAVRQAMGRNPHTHTR